MKHGLRSKTKSEPGNERNKEESLHGREENLRPWH